METKARRTVYLSEGAWNSIGKLSKELHISRSAVIELMAVKLEAAETEPLGKIIQGVLVEVLGMLKTEGKSKNHRPSS